MTNGKTTALSELQAIAAEAFAVLDTGHQISPVSARLSAFDLDEALRELGSTSPRTPTRALSECSTEGAH
jgi:hypothetical protein